MLQSISVKNFAIIENIEVEFNEGMTALTGETGAGKSLLIDAIGLLLGDRATSNIVRTGSSKAEVEGVFFYQHPRIKTLLSSYDIDSSSNELIIRRQVTPTNNNIIKINNKTVTLQQLREVTSLLADIHTQYDTHRLINQDTYIDIIDGFHQEETEKLLREYRNLLAKYKKELKELNRLKQSKDDLLERYDLLTYQIKELDSYNLDPNEEETLNEEISKMENFDKIYQSLHETLQLFEATNAVDRIYDASKQIETIESYNPTYGQLKERVSSSYYELSDIVDTLQDELQGMDFNPRLLDENQNRLNDLDRLKRKYRKSIPELLEYVENSKKDIENMDNYDDVITNQESIVQSGFQAVSNAAKSLSKRRKETALFLEKELVSILDDLELPNTAFSIEFTTQLENDHLDSTVFHEHGIDTVDFMLSTNIGEPKKPLSKAASGGEMSRIMLGLKNLLIRSLALSLIIFDEIDTGVSGYVANQVAKKMHEISRNTQVICITHIPQVAAQSDQHLFVQKEVINDRTKAFIRELEGQERIEEIATMISGDAVTSATLQSAKELLHK